MHLREEDKVVAGIHHRRLKRPSVIFLVCLVNPVGHIC